MLLELSSLVWGRGGREWQRGRKGGGEREGGGREGEERARGGERGEGGSEGLEEKRRAWSSMFWMPYLSVKLNHSQ